MNFSNDEIIGNKASSAPKQIDNENDTDIATRKARGSIEAPIKYEIIPTAFKFNKIDLVKYGQVFDNYQGATGTMLLLKPSRC